LNGVVDYKDNSVDRYIVVRIDEYHFIGYNRAASFNSGVMEAPNQVTIIEGTNRERPGSETKLVAKLSVGDSYTIVFSELLKVVVTYASNSTGKDAVIDIKFDGDAQVCQYFYDAEIDLELVTDKNPKDTSMGILDNLGQPIFYKSRYSFQLEYTTYTETVTGLCRGVLYYFYIEDHWGNGLCCDFGEGSYRGLFEGEEIFSGDGDFSSSDLVPFILPPDDDAPGPIGCVDDPNFVKFRNNEAKDCNYLAAKPDEKIIIGCNRPANKLGTDRRKVYDYCKATCNAAGIDKACDN
jgi:hypothetical protein